MESKINKEVEKSRVFIVGFAKCATTSLDNWLNSLPDISCSRPKEPHWYMTDIKHSIIKSRLEYDDSFASGDILVDTSVWYIYSRASIDNIIKDHPNAKFIVIYRPIKDFLKSLHSQMLFTGYERERDISKAFANSGEDMYGGSYRNPKLQDVQLLDYKRHIDMRSQLELLCSKVFKENVLIVEMQAMISNPQSSLRSILDFIGVNAPDLDYALPKENTRKVRRIHILVQIEYRIRSIYNKLGINGLGTGMLTYIDKLNRTSSTISKSNSPEYSEELEKMVSIEQSRLTSYLNELDDNNWNIIR